MRLDLTNSSKNVLSSVIDARKLLPFAFVLMLCFLVALAWDSFSRTRELLNSQAFVERTNNVLHEMDGVEDGLQDAREAALHYVLTPEKEDLVTFEDAVAQVWMRLDRIAVMTKDDEGYPERIASLRQSIKAELQQLRDNLRTTKTLLIFHTPDADRNRDRVRDGIQKFKDAEEALLSQRNEAARNRAHDVERSVSVRIGVFIAFMAVLFLLVLRESKKLRIAEQTALNAQTRLEGSLQQLQVETESGKLLNELQNNLQICINPPEAYEVLGAYAQKLAPNSAGAVFAIDNSRNLMGVMASWGDSLSPTQHILSPEDCCAMRGGRLHLRVETSEGLSCRHFSGSIPDAYLCLPLAALGETLGVLHISVPTSDVLSAGRLAMIQQSGEYAALRLANLRLREKLHDQSIRDPLTGLYNRRFLEAALEQELHRSSRHHSGLGVIMADIDKFKAFNDNFGHTAGDIVLKEVGALLRRSVRTEDIVCRYGGEEFLMVLPDTSLESVRERAEAMRDLVAKLELQHAGHALGKITASFGISFSQDGVLTPDILLRYADEALYESKRRGCNCVSLSDSVANLLSEKQLPGGKEPASQPLTFKIAQS
ncbi:MAG TPA: diguanylate cyclase [Candidatus Angelobacter sp.]|nr:diguanylate cyclase [Candidatus Angelobacter sp.]